MPKSVFENFDPNATAQIAISNIFGLPSTEENSDLIIVPVPWEVTTSYRPGTADGPSLIYDASMQIDLFDLDIHNAWKKGIYMPEEDEVTKRNSEHFRKVAEQIIEKIENGKDDSENESIAKLLNEVNEASGTLNEWVYTTTTEYLQKGKKVALLGGDHSTPYGFIKALAAVHDSFAILQIDAHADLRKAYQGFQFSHASIMYNVMEHIPQVNRLIQLGLRDYCDEEYEYAKNSEEKITVFSDKDIKNKMYEGSTWKNICDRIIAILPQKVYISFDIDGLDPKLCPNTGTPVPGGFELEQIFYLFHQLRIHNKTIIGFDLNEVSGSQNSIDPIVGARVLYKLCGHLLLSE